MTIRKVYMLHYIEKSHTHHAVTPIPVDTTYTDPLSNPSGIGYPGIANAISHVQAD